MCSVWKPEKDPPCLDKYCHLSHDAQRVMLALYSDYLQCRSDILETKRIASNSKSYYQSMYEARFGKFVDGRHQQSVLSIQGSSNSRAEQYRSTPDTGNEPGDSGLGIDPFKLASKNISHTARRLDFNNPMNSTVVQTNYQKVNKTSLQVSSFNKIHKLIDERKSALSQHIRSPESSNYSDSPPIETHDFRILSQFQRDEVEGSPDELESLTEHDQQPSTVDNENMEPFQDKLEMVPYFHCPQSDNSFMDTSSTVIQSCTGSIENNMKPAENNLHKSKSCAPVNNMIINNLTIENSTESNSSINDKKESTFYSPELELPGSQSLFSQTVSDNKSRTVKERRPIHKHCVTLQKSYQTKSNRTYTASRPHPNSKTDQESPDIQADVTIPLEFSKKLDVSPPVRMENIDTNPANYKPELQQSVQEFNFKPILSSDINKRMLADNKNHPEDDSTCRNNKVINTVCGNVSNNRHIQKDTRSDRLQTDEENPLSFIRNAQAPKTVSNMSSIQNRLNNKSRNGASDTDKQKMYPIFSRQNSAHQDRIMSSSVQNEQGKRKSKSSQYFDTPFKKQKTVDQDVNKLNRQSASLPSKLKNIDSLSPAEMSAVLSNILEAEEVTLVLIYSDNSTQLRHNLFGQETKRRPAGRQKSSSPANVSSVALGAKTDQYKNIYLFSAEKQTFHKTRDFWKSLMGSPMRKIGFKTKCLFTELMLLCDATAMSDWQVLDAEVAVWLLNSDKPVSNFEQLLTLYGFPEQMPCDSSMKALPEDMLLLSNVVKKLTQDLRQQELLPLFHDVECRLTPLLAAMEQRELHVATHTLLKFSEILKKKLQKLEQQAHQAAGHPFLLSSHAQLRQVLFETLRLDTKLPRQTKLAKTTVGRETSTSEAVLTQLSPHHPLPAIVLEHRQLQKLKSTYIDGILSCVYEGRLQTHWDQTAAATGRLTSYQPNIQAIPKTPVVIEGYTDNFVVGKEKSDRMEIYARDCFVSQPGYSLMAADFQQIELRLLGHLTNDPVLIKIFNDPEVPDIFNALTAEWLGKTSDTVTSGEREQTKRVVYSVMYGAGKDKLAEYLKISTDNAKAIMMSFLLKFPAVNQFTNACVEYCRKHGYTRTILKRKRLFGHIRHPSAALRAQAERQCVNFCVQGSAADLCKAAMLHVEQALSKNTDLNARLLVQIHDELLFEVADTDIEEITGLVTSVMESCDRYCGAQLSLHVPLAVSISVGKTWGHLKPVYRTGQQNTSSE